MTRLCSVLEEKPKGSWAFYLTATTRYYSILIMKNALTDEGSVNTTEAAVTDVLRALKAHGYPMTSQRRSLVSLVISQVTHFSAEDLRDELDGMGLSIGRATVFRTLELLSRLGYLSRIPEGDRLLYTVCNPGHHHHLTCSACGKVLHLEDCPAAAFLEELRSQTGYLIEQHHLDFSGICPTCQKNS